MVLNTPEEYNETLKYITTKATHLSLQTTPNELVSSWIKQALYTFISLMFTFAITATASDIEAGKTIEISGGKRGIKRIMLSIAESLGTLNSILIGSVITLGFAFLAYKNYKKGQGVITVYK